MGRAINIGFIGMGGMAGAQANAFSTIEGCRIYSGADPSETARSNFKERYPEIRTFDDSGEMLEDPELDAVVVVTPTSMHKNAAISALKAGKPVLTEKPMARTVADCQEMIKASRETGMLLMVAQCRRFDPVWGSWAEVVRSGALGSPVLWRSAGSGVMGGWFMDADIGGGPMLDMGVHDYDFANMLWGDPESVVASSTKLNKNVTAVDTATAVIRYAGGNQLMVSRTWAGRGMRMFDILGPNGTIVEGIGTQAPSAIADATNYYCLIAPDGTEQLIEPAAETMKMYEIQAQHFLDCINGKARCISPPEEAIKAIAIAEAIIGAGPEGIVRKVTWQDE